MSLLDSQNGLRREPASIVTPRGASTESVSQSNLDQRAAAVAAVASTYADDVDRAARFPAEAMAATKMNGLLGILVPADLGGEGASVSQVADICYALGRACASTGMIYAMHQMMVACLVRHGRGNAWHERFLRRIADEQLLLASSTTEGMGGGDLRNSSCAVEPQGARIAVAKSATVVSYGAQADSIVTTARRAPDAAPSDQVLVALAKSDYALNHLVDWDTLGMRGTCSAGFMLRGEGDPAQMLPVPYQKIHAQTGMPVAHLAWSAVWTGIAAGAVDRARNFTRVAARGRNGQLPPGAAHVTRASANLRMLRALVSAHLQRYEACLNDERALESIDFQAAMNLLKVTASELAVEIVTGALLACGLAGYRNDGEFSVSRHLRDVLSSPIMINNDRILANTASATLLVDVPAALTH